MLSLIKWVAAPALVAAMTLVSDAPTAEAGNSWHVRSGGLSISVGGGAGRYHSNYGYGGHHGYHSYRPSYHPSYRPSYHGSGLHGARHHGGYHQRGHYDYHPTQVYRHGHHFHVQPGHYDYHRGGHGHR